MSILVTGGAGFIGSAVVRHLLAETDDSVVNLDRLSYAGSRKTLADFDGQPRHCFEQADICDAPAMARVFDTHQPTAVMHLAAESHVDRSIDGPAEFIRTNITGTFTLLDTALAYWRKLDEPRREQFRFLHVSTDEVYGSLSMDDPPFTEQTPYAPNSPYAASKAASDHLARAWWKTYGLPVVVSNCSNNYGPFQFPEKLIPLIIGKALRGEPLPVYGTGENVRDWLFVDDHASALHTIARRGRLGECYNVGGDCERSNIQLVREICGLLDELCPSSASVPHAQLIQFVEDRPGHDLRYAMDASKISSELGWSPATAFSTGLRQTVQWYMDNVAWCSAVSGENDPGERLGLVRSSAE